MDADLSPLAALEAQLRKLDAVGVDIAKEAAPEVEKLARSSAAAGTDAYGTPWKPTKDGSAPLKHAAQAIRAIVSGATSAVIVLVLRGHDVFHHFGVGKTIPARPILPDPEKGIPEAMGEAIRAATRRVIAKAMGGGR